MFVCFLPRPCCCGACMFRGADAGTNPGGWALTPSSTPLCASRGDAEEAPHQRRSGSHCRESFDPTREGRRAGDARLPSHRLMLLLPRVAQGRLWLQGAPLSVVGVYLDDCVLSVKLRQIRPLCHQSVYFLSPLLQLKVWRLCWRQRWETPVT